MLVSIIIPTYNEAKNVPLLVGKIDSIMKKENLPYECIIVDDSSPDGTYEIANGLKSKFSVRTFLRKERGLSSAMLFGLEKARGDIIGCIDADLQHNPDVVPKLIRAIANEEYQMAVGSRIVTGGGVERWGWHRRLISLTGRIMVRPLTKVNDTMSGFFFLKPKVIEGIKLNPIGYKLGLEIMVKGNHNGNIKEVPYVFTGRLFGTSKMNFKIYIAYLWQIFLLYLYKFSPKLSSKIASKSA